VNTRGFALKRPSPDCIFYEQPQIDSKPEVTIEERPEESLSPKRKRFWTPGTLALAGGILLAASLFFLFASPHRPSLDSLRAPARIEPPPPPLPDRVIAGRIAKGQNLSSALRAQDLPRDLVEAICLHLKSVINLRRINPGESFEARLSPEGRFLNLTYTAGPLDVYHLSLTPGGEWIAAKKEIPVDQYWVRVSGEISSSLFDAMDDLGEKDSLIMDFADIFAWEIDFNVDPQPGDRFQMVVEKYFTGDVFVRYGRILYAEYRQEARTHEAVYFEGPGIRGDYFTPQGESLRKALLRSPLKFTRISSGYSRSRWHPILGGYHPHLGVDYAAPQGTPVWAVADGTVASCGWNGGYGKQVVIRHAKGYQSMYGHLSGYGPGISRGKVVRQKQIIGYVGSTGLATGPHLDFRLLKNGAPRNPLREISPRAPALPRDQMPEFQKRMDPLLSWAGDSSALPRRKIASLTSKDLETLHWEKRK
jgi:murein DD-endopeptidase MepM/ murein hydrolase activator NlpD